MKSIAYIPGSDGAANASLMTITAVRSSGATTIQTNTVANVPTKFYASMGTPHTFTDPVTGETITVVSETTAVDFAGRVDGSNIEIVEIAPGYTDNGSAVGDIIIIRPVTEWANNIHNILAESHEDDGTLKESAIVYEPALGDFIRSGAVWSTLTGLNGAMTEGVAYIDGRRITIPAIASKAFTASKDTYVFIDNTGAPTYSEQTVNASQPATPAGTVICARVRTSGSAITNVTKLYPNPMTGIAKYTDENGWTVHDFGTHKQYMKKSNVTTIDALGASGSVSFSNYPVGVTSAMAQNTHVIQTTLINYDTRAISSLIRWSTTISSGVPVVGIRNDNGSGGWWSGYATATITEL